MEETPSNTIVLAYKDSPKVRKTPSRKESYCRDFETGS
jgi:hypothetical protein